MVKQRTIRKTILLNSFIIVSIPLLIFLYFSVRFITGIYVEEIISRNQIITMNLAEHFELLHEEPAHITDFIYDNYLKESDVLNEEIPILLHDFVNSYPSILNIEILDEQGTVVSSAIRNKDIGINRSGEDFYVQLSKEKDAFYWSHPYVSTATGSLTYSMARKTASDYYILVYSSLKSLSESSEIYAGKFGEDVHVTIIDQVGRYISHEDIEKVNIRMIDSNISNYKDVAAGKLPYCEVFIDNDSYVANVSLMPTPNWYVVVYQPTSSVFGYMNILMMILIGTTMMIIVLIIFYTLRFSGQINSFIQGIKKSMDAAIENQFISEDVDFRFYDLNELYDRFQTLMFEIKQRDQRLYDAAYYNPLSQLGNRLLMNDYLDDLTVRKTRQEIAFVLINIDGFKVINDIYGHDIGDALVCFLAKELKLIKESYQCEIFHLSIDEFALIISMSQDIEKLKEILMPISNLMMQSILINNRLLRVGMTMGISYYPNQANDSKKLYQFADIALMEGKDKSKGSINMYEPNMRERIEANSKLELLLRNSLQNNRFELHLQPQINVSDGSIYGFEALVRLKNYNGDSISPVEFIPVAENTGFIMKLGEWILHEAINIQKQLNGKFNSSFRISINISTIQMRSSEFKQIFLDALLKHNADISLVDLEITESVFINDDGIAFQTISALSEAGTNFALDDFGTGYSSLSYLTTLPFKVLKIDRTFIANMEDSLTKKNMLQSIIEMGHRLDLTIIAEGVETEEQLKICKDFGVDIVQGFYYSRPLNRGALEEYIHVNLKQRLRGNS